MQIGSQGWANRCISATSLGTHLKVITKEVNSQLTTQFGMVINNACYHSVQNDPHPTSI